MTHIFFIYSFATRIELLYESFFLSCNKHTRLMWTQILKVNKTSEMYINELKPKKSISCAHNNYTASNHRNVRWRRQRKKRNVRQKEEINLQHKRKMEDKYWNNRYECMRIKMTQYISIRKKSIFVHFEVSNFWFENCTYSETMSHHCS